ncbi:hypothetical protein ACFV1W_13285 [Kitasatospora sp. NPDC059648]|uniref:hypothetical protein n=1 Tax=Kitasatospora sp. NPDC059648 TaxID=3346894 RepID=UPI0036C69B17
MLERATSPQAAVRELLGEPPLWWNCCSEAVRVDPAWLSSRRCEELSAWLDATAPDQDTASVAPADHALFLARALAAPEGGSEDHDAVLLRLTEVWEQSGLLCADAVSGPAQPSGKGLADLSPCLARGLSVVFERSQHLRASAGSSATRLGAESVLVIAALLMASLEPRRRPAVRVPVVFGRSAGPDGRTALTEGATGVLELREFPPGPAGLYPDPRAMAGVRSPNGQFAAALGHAWRLAGPRREGRCVLWRIVLSDEPAAPAQIEGPSLGAAFALGLRELLRHPPSGRPGIAWLRGVFYGLRPRTAVTGALDGGERLLKVSDMDAKLLAARRRGLRLVVPEANRLDAAKAPEPGDVRFAATLRQADRHARRFRTGRLAVALSLVAASGAGAAVVTHQDAVEMARLTTAHRLVDVSQSLLASDTGLAALFAAQAYREHPDQLTRTALFQAVTASPHLADSMQASGTVSALSSSADGRVALAGTQQGDVEQWTLTGTKVGPARRLGRLPGTVTAVAADADGSTVAAIDRGTVQVWATAQPVATPRISSGQRPTTVAVSPSGRFVAVTTTTDQFDTPRTLWVLDRATGGTGHFDLDLHADPSATAFSDDTHVVAFESGYGGWERISLPELARVAGSTVGFGVHNQASALAPDGGHFTYTNGATAIPVWASDGAPDIDHPSLHAQTQAGHPATALALSHGGSWAAEAVGSSIYVSRTTAPDQSAPAPVVLTGAGTVTRGALAFLGGDGNRLISASGDMLSLWDLAQYSRIATPARATIPLSCNGCRGPGVFLSPDGRSAAVIDGNGVSLDVEKLQPPGTGWKTSATADGILGDQGFAAALWQNDGSGLIVVSPQDGSAQILSAAGGFGITGAWQPVPSPLQLPDAAAVLQFLPDGRQVAQIDNSGTIRFRDTMTGKVLRQLDGPRDMAPTAEGSGNRSPGWAALDTKADHAAVIDSGSLEHRTEKVVVTDTATGRSRLLSGSGAVGVAFAADHLLIQRANGTLEVWTSAGDRLLNTLQGTPDTSVGPVVGGTLLAEKPLDDTVRLIDLQSGQTFGTLNLPHGSKDRSTGMAFSADGTELVTATESGGDATGDVGTLITWKLDPSAWLRAACEAAGRNLTPDVWTQYLGTQAPSDLRCA